MLNSFFRIALRCLWRKKSYSLLNFVCLTFGLTCAIITVPYIRNVFSYDKFQEKQMVQRLFQLCECC
jgi:putative ABC transport system permease protein